MALSWWRRWFGRLVRPARRTLRPVPRRRGARLLLETLEDRLTPATHTWTGATISDPHWSNAGNWTGGAPQPGESNVVLIFGPGAQQKQTFDDVANLSVQQINLTDTGYILSGSTFLTLTGGIADTTANSGTSPLPNNEIQINMALAGQDTVQVAGVGRALVLSGTLTGTGGLTKVGPGALDLSSGTNEGSGVNSYAGPTQVNEGSLLLDKFQAVAGPLVVGDGVGGPNADQVFMRTANATASNIPVTVTPSGELIVGDGQSSPSAQAIGSLDMTGGEVLGTPGFSSLPASLLTLTAGGVTSHPSATTARIDANLSLGGSTRTFDVGDGGGQPDLLVTGVISDQGPVSSFSSGGTSADLGVTVTAPSSAQIGQTFEYDITVTNFGPGAAQGVTLSDPLPANTTFSSESQSGGPTFNCSTPPVGQGGTVTCTTGTLGPPNQSATFFVSVQVSSSATNGSTLSNTATVSSTTPDPNPKNNSFTATTTVQAQADLGVSETGPAATPTSIQNLTYTLTVTNIGPTEATNVTLSDAVPSGTTFQSETHPAGWTRTDTTPVGGTGTLTWTINPLLAGASGTFQVVVQAGGGSPVTNTVTISSPTPDPNPDNNTATITTGSQTNVSVTKTGPQTVTAGTPATYTISVTNSGPDAAENLTLSDTLPQGLSFASESQAPGHPIFTCSNTTSSFTCSANDLASGQSATFTLTVNVASSALQGSSISNTATVSTTNTNLSSNTSSTWKFGVVAVADLAVSKFAPQTIPAGSNLTYNIFVANNGPSDAQSVTLTDAVPANTTFVSVSGSGSFSCSGPISPGAPITCTATSVAANSQSFITVVVNVNSSTPNGTVITNTASVSTTTTDPTLNDNTGTATTTVAPSSSSGGTSGGGTVFQGGLTKVGAGLLMLTGNNTYVGPTTLAGSGLIVDGSQPGSPVVVNAGTLFGHGVLGPTSVAGGNISPLETPGGTPTRLTVMGDFTLGGGGTFVARITNAGTTVLHVTGTVSLAGFLDVGAGIPAGNGNAFTIIENAGPLPVQGTFLFRQPDGSVLPVPEGGLLPGAGVCVHVSYKGNNANNVVLQGVGDAYLFVRGVYHGLNITVDEVEVNRLVNILEAGHLSEAVRRKVATDIWNSLAHRQAEIALFYKSFGESTGDGQFTKLLNALTSTSGNEGAVLIKFLTSKPFLAAHRNRKQYVNLLLQVLTGKTPRRRDVRTGLQLLAQGKGGRIRWVTGLLSSKVVYQEALAEHFHEFLGKTAKQTVPDVNFFLPLLAAGAVTPLQLMLDVVTGSPASNPSVPFDYATQFRDFLRKNCLQISQLPTT
jgi:uncharacterized repeat protein (TIGR01451 family)